MIKEIHFSTALYKRLTSVLEEGGCSALPAFLSTLSVSQFRTAGYILGEKIAIEVEPEVFWELFRTLICFNNRAFLTTMLYALSQRLKGGETSLREEGFQTLLPELTKVDSQKLLQHLLPLQQEPAQVTQLLDWLKIEDAHMRIRLLLPVATLPCAYVLFRTLRYVEHDHSLLLRVAVLLIRQGNSISFNLASIMKEFFALNELKGTFSLRLSPWQLARLETSYEAFSQAINF